MTNPSVKIVIANNLQSFFYDQLTEVNKKSLLPVADPLIVYSSVVLNKFTHSEKYFENVKGRLREKVLGMKLLDANNHDYDERRKILRDIGDTTMILCGHFRNSIKEKVLNVSYYKEIGKSAYINLNTMGQNFLDVPDFYQNLALSFDSIVSMISSISRMSNPNNAIMSKYGEWLETKSDEIKKELQIMGVKVDEDEKKVS